MKFPDLSLTWKKILPPTFPRLAETRIRGFSLVDTPETFVLHIRERGVGAKFSHKSTQKREEREEQVIPVYILNV